MASPQRENGHTDIANEVMDALAKIRISGEARQVLDCIIRKTWGWHKKSDPIALSQFVEATGLSKVAVCKNVLKLRAMNLIITLPKKVMTVTQKGNGIITSYCFNKDYDSWIPLPKKVTLPKKVMTVTQKGNKSLPKKVHTKETITKETITKETNPSSPLKGDDGFESFWKRYPRKVGKGAAGKAWGKLKPDKALVERILEAIADQKESEHWCKEGGRYIPNPATWLNQERWQDDLKPMYNDPTDEEIEAWNESYKARQQGGTDDVGRD